MAFMRLFFTMILVSLLGNPCLAFEYEGHSIVKRFGTDAQQGLEEVTIRTPSGVEIIAEIANTPQKRATGLMFRQHMDEDRGMLFIFPEAQHWTIWMKNTNIPLDILWLNQKKTIVHVEINVPGCSRSGTDCPQYQPIRKALYALELPAGTAHRLQLTNGVRLLFPDLQVRSR